MQRFTFLLTAVASLSLALCLTSCGDRTGDGPIIMKVGHAQPVSHPRHDAFVRFKELVEQRSDGRLQVDIHPSAELGNERELMESTRLGTIQGCRSGAFEDASRKLLILTLPFLFRDLPHVHAVLSGPIGDEIAASTEAKDIKLLAWADSGGLRQFTNNRHPINTPDDLDGLKMRTPGVETSKIAMREFGAVPAPVPFAELYLALKTGVADGQENPYIHIYHQKLWEVQEYLSIVNWQYHPDAFYVNLDWFNDLPAELQQVLEQSAEEAARYSDELHEAQSVEAYEAIKENGMKINEVSEADRQMFIDRAQAVYEHYIDGGLVDPDLIERIRQTQ